MEPDIKDFFNFSGNKYSATSFLRFQYKQTPRSLTPKRISVPFSVKENRQENPLNDVARHFKQLDLLRGFLRWISTTTVSQAHCNDRLAPYFRLGDAQSVLKSACPILQIHEW